VIWSPELKIALLMGVCFLGMILAFLMVCLKSVGGIGHSLDRIEELVAKEAVATLKRRKILARKEKQRKATESDRSRRHQALLNIPLMSLKRKEAPDGEKKEGKP
jgi:hypothetical protein